MSHTMRASGPFHVLCIEQGAPPPGLHVQRLRISCNNPREVAFWEQWRKEHERIDLLIHLFRVPCGEKEEGAKGDPWKLEGTWKEPLGEPTERDRIVAATVIQWLGSNCGFDMVRQALEKCGYLIVKEEAKK